VVTDETVDEEENGEDQTFLGLSPANDYVLEVVPEVTN
jgi:hypothetical protein